MEPRGPLPPEKKGFISLHTHRQIISPQEFFTRCEIFDFSERKQGLCLQFSSPAKLAAQGGIVVVIGHMDEAEEAL